MGATPEVLPPTEAAGNLFDDLALHARVLQKLYPDAARLRVLQQLDGDAL